MTRDDIIRMAREAGLQHFYDSEGHCSGVTTDKIEGEENDDALVEMLAPFAALVAAAEREACAKVCDMQIESGVLSEIEKYRAGFIADVIRARGESK